MTQAPLYQAAAMLLFALGLHGLLLARQLLRRIIGMNVMGSGVFMLLCATAATTDPPDPVPHALVITGIVVALATTALAIGLALRLHASIGGPEPDSAAEADR